MSVAGPKFVDKTERPACSVRTRAAGGTVGIDQEVVTLRGLSATPGPGLTCSRADRNPNSPVVCGL